MEKVNLKETVEVINTELVFPTHANHYGTIFGGRVLELMDITGALAAMQFANEDAVTASIEAVDFKKPIKVGDIVELKARVIFTANTSMVVKVDVYRVGKFHSKRDFSCSGFIVFVAVDANGEPRPVILVNIPFAKCLLGHLRFHLGAVYFTIGAGQALAAVGPPAAERGPCGAAVVVNHMLYNLDLAGTTGNLGYGLFLERLDYIRVSA